MADMMALGAIARKSVRVRLPSPAPKLSVDLVQVRVPLAKGRQMTSKPDAHIEIVSGRLIPETWVEMETTGPFFKAKSAGMFVGDYVETDGGEVHFMFRGGHINGHARTHFAEPASRFNEEVLASYTCTGGAQAIHERGEHWDI
jgi:hypothetical protein